MTNFTTSIKAGTIIMLLLAILATGAAALSIESPAIGAHESPVQVSVSENTTANATADSISFSISPSGENASCENCTSLSRTFALAPGDYSITASSSVGNETQQASRAFSVSEPAPAEFTLALQAPLSATYNTTSVPVHATTNESIDRIEYRLDGANYTSACTNCSSIDTAIIAAEGSHTLSVRATRDSLVKIASADFSIVLPLAQNQTNQTNNGNTTNQSTNATPLSLSIVSPLSRTYGSDVTLRFVASKTGTITYTLNGTTTNACTNCAVYQELRSLANGTYTLSVTALAGNESVTQSVTFIVAARRDGRNETEENGAHEPRFTTGLEKLPQLLEQGNISDADLAALIRGGKLNPGIIERLIKTGKLGSESITAILETQKTTRSIVRKIADFIGFHIKTPQEQLFEYYNLSVEQDAKVLTSPELSVHIGDQVRERLREKQQEQQVQQAEHGSDKNQGNSQDSQGNGRAQEKKTEKTFLAGNQSPARPDWNALGAGNVSQQRGKGFMAPGQQKKMDDGRQSNNGNSHGKGRGRN